MLHDLQAEYERLREELARLQAERRRLDTYNPPLDDDERAYAFRLRTFHRAVVLYLQRLEQAASKDGNCDL
jgi:hypothetical protein